MQKPTSPIKPILFRIRIPSLATTKCRLSPLHSALGNSTPNPQHKTKIPIILLSLPTYTPLFHS